MVLVQPDGTVWGSVFDEAGNVLSVTDPLGAVTTCTYLDGGRLSTVTDAAGNRYSVTTDAAGLPSSVTNPLGRTTHYDRDGFGRVVAVTDPLGNTTRHEWTVEGRPSTRRFPDGSTERWVYDAEGNLVEEIDALGQVTRIEVAGFDLPAARITPDGSRLVFSHDTELRLVAVTNAQGAVWRYEYDPAGNLVREIDFNGRVLTYDHDAAGQLSRRTNGAGQAVSYIRDLLGNVTRQESDAVAVFCYDIRGLLVRATNPDADLRIERDPLGRVTAETCNGRTTRSAYDVLGQRVERRTPAGVDSRWTYDGAGNPVTLSTTGRTVRFARDATGREVQRQLSDGVALAQTWDANSRLLSQVLNGPEASSGEVRTDGMQARDSGGGLGRTFSYRADGYLSRIDDVMTGRTVLELDPVGRVTSASGAGWTERYAYDSSGNITEGWWGPDGGDEAEVQGPRSYSGTLLQRAGSVTYDHDAQGRVVMRRRKRLSAKPLTTHYTWDAHDSLVEVTTSDGSRWQYSYDALGRRIAKLSHSAKGIRKVDFTWDGDLLVEREVEDDPAEPGPSGRRVTTWEWEPDTFRVATQSEYVRYEDPGQEVSAAHLYIVVPDPVGRPMELVTPEGRIVWRSHTNLWGSGENAARTGIDCPLRFPGHYRDAETGLHYNHHRYYDPGTARYQSGDALGLLAGANPHAYVLNPTQWYDPLGLSPYKLSGWMSPSEWASCEIREVRNLFRTAQGATETGQHGAGLRSAAAELKRRVKENGYLPEINDILLKKVKEWENKAKTIDHAMNRRI